MKRIFPNSFYNLITLGGLAISVVSFGLILFLIMLESVSGHQKPYMGIIAFVILPAVLIIGVLLIIIGILREHRKVRHGKSTVLHLPTIDFSNPHQRTAAVIFGIGMIVLLLFSAFGSFKAYEHTDSDEFCGTTCHQVMEPEYTAYQFSPHARVGCVQCHIGSGADWFVRSKISGTYQVYAVLFDKYPRPIPTPIQNLRPAQETCEQCHWPKHFFSEKQHQNNYFLSDEKNTKWMLDLLIKIGGGNSEAGPTSGIHWHMNIANEVTYAALDSQRQIIAWVRTKDQNGKDITYWNTAIDKNDLRLRTSSVRRMDCIDCHNRPSHIYRPPARSINHVMTSGWIDPSLPSVKSITVKALEAPYQTKQEALDGIHSMIEQFYTTQYPDIARKKKKEIDRAIDEVQKIYSRNYFPEMKVDWKRFIDNIGHLYYPGCFRCHDEKHTSSEGKTLSKDCNTCHVILAQKLEKDSLRLSLGGIEYNHPVDIGNAWMEMNCSDCHNPQ